MEFKGTSGPWRVDTIHSINGKNHPICKVESGEWGDTFPIIKQVGPTLLGAYKAEIEMIAYGNIPKEEADANAKLICAAPELLKALQAIVNIEYLISYSENTSIEHQGEAQAVNQAMNNAKQAIEKALK